MTWVRLAAVTALMVAFATAGYCRATKSWQLTTDGRSVRGVFSPSGDAIAYLRYGQKHFAAKTGDFGFEVQVRVRAGDRDHQLLRIAPRLRRVDSTVPKLATPYAGVRWLPSGRYLVADSQGTPDFWLLAPDGSLCTKAGTYRGWFVLNKAVPLSRDDGVALNGFLRADDIDPSVPPWLWDGTTPLSARNAPVLFGCGLPLGHDAGRGGSVAQASGVQFATWRLTGASSDGNTVPLPLLRFVDHDPSEAMLSPDGRWVAYVRDPSGRLPRDDHTASGYDLWVRRSSGGGDHRVAREAGSWHLWLTNEWLLFTGPRTAVEWERQWGVANARTGTYQRLTAGPYRHMVTDFRQGRFLVEEHPPWEYPTGEYTANLYVIQPLRVRM